MPSPEPRARQHRGQHVVAQLPLSRTPRCGGPRPPSVGGVRSGRASLPTSADRVTESSPGLDDVLGFSSAASFCLTWI